MYSNKIFVAILAIDIKEAFDTLHHRCILRYIKRILHHASYSVLALFSMEL
ncbi:Hypothetical protein FKW44_013212, partial [Caligus rogercresseyi]